MVSLACGEWGDRDLFMGYAQPISASAGEVYGQAIFRIAKHKRTIPAKNTKHHPSNTHEES